MPWLQIILDTDAQTTELLSDQLFTLGAVSVTLQDAADQPLYEPPLDTTPLWGRTQVIGLFENQTDSLQLQTQLQALWAPLPLPPCQIKRLADQDWNQVWMTDFHPRLFGERVWICPSWQPPPEPPAVNILLDPGLAFGTGTHATTALCLEWLDQQTDWSNKTLIDYGCGSGILAITAAKLGATQVWAVDNDPQALLATHNNATKNGIETIISTVLPEQLPKITTSGLIANILAGPLITLAPTFAAYLNSGAPLVLSGILAEQANEVIATYLAAFIIREVVERDNWLRIVATKI